MLDLNGLHRPDSINVRAVETPCSKLWRDIYTASFKRSGNTIMAKGHANKAVKEFKESIS